MWNGLYLVNINPSILRLEMFEEETYQKAQKRVSHLHLVIVQPYTEVRSHFTYLMMVRFSIHFLNHNPITRVPCDSLLSMADGHVGADCLLGVLFVE